MTRLEKLREACQKVALWVATWSPGDGITRYRFFDKPGNTYFGPDDGIKTELGYKDACTFARSRGAQI